MFGLDLIQSYCVKQLTELIRFCGGLDIEVSRVIFVRGSRDSWNKLDITRTKTNDCVAINVNGIISKSALATIDFSKRIKRFIYRRGFLYTSPYKFKYALKFTLTIDIYSYSNLDRNFINDNTEC